MLRVFAAQDYLEALDDDRRLLDARFAVVQRDRLEQTLVCRYGGFPSRRSPNRKLIHSNE